VMPLGAALRVRGAMAAASRRVSKRARRDASSPTSSPAPAQHFLIKSEPDDFSLSDLEGSPGGTTAWDGVRNYAARNVMRQMRPGDRALYYHSSCKVPAVVGEVEVVREHYPDPACWDPSSRWYDAKSTGPGDARWSLVDVRFVRRLPREVPLSELRGHGAEEGAPLHGMPLLCRPRLSVQPVSPEHYAYVLALSEGAPPP